MQKRISRNNNTTKVKGFYNFGLGGSNRVENLLFNKNLKGNSGLRGSLSPSYNRDNIPTEVRTVELKKASDILKPLIQENQDLKSLLKWIVKALSTK